MRAGALASTIQPGPRFSFGDVRGSDSLSGGFQDGALPFLSKCGGVSTVTLSALFLELGWEGVTDFATGGPAA